MLLLSTVYWLFSIYATSSKQTCTRLLEIFIYYHCLKWRLELKLVGLASLAGRVNSCSAIQRCRLFITDWPAAMRTHCEFAFVVVPTTSWFWTFCMSIPFKCVSFKLMLWLAQSSRQKLHPIVIVVAAHCIAIRYVERQQT